MTIQRDNQQKVPTHIIKNYQQHQHTNTISTKQNDTQKLVKIQRDNATESTNTNKLNRSVITTNKCKDNKNNPTT